MATHIRRSRWQRTRESEEPGGSGASRHGLCCLRPACRDHMRAYGRLFENDQRNPAEIGGGCFGLLLGVCFVLFLFVVLCGFLGVVVLFVCCLGGFLCWLVFV